MTNTIPSRCRQAARLSATVAVLLACSGCPPASPSQDEQRQAVTSHWITVEHETPGREPFLNEDDLNAISHSVPTISTVVAELVRTERIKSDDIELEAVVCGTTPSYLRLLEEGARVKVRQGHFFESREGEPGANVVVLSEGLAERLFRNADPVGQSVVLEGKQLTVAGVVTDGAAWGSDVKRDAYVPRRVLSQDADQSAALFYDRLRFRVDSLNEVKPTEEIIQAIVEQRHPDQSVRVRSFLTGTN